MERWKDGRYRSFRTLENKNFKRRSRETGKIKIVNLTVGVHNTTEISGTKMRK